MTIADDGDVMTMKEIIAVYQGRNADATSALYARLREVGHAGVVAVNLLRVARNSEMAKGYRSRRSTAKAYDVKDWAIGELCRALAESEGVVRGWGWGRDEGTVNFESVLYVDLPTGQVSFHVRHRRDGPDYPGVWDGTRGTAMARICAFVWMIINGREAPTEEENHGGAEDGTEGGAGEGAAGSAAAGSAGWSKDRQGALDI